MSHGDGKGASPFSWGARSPWIGMALCFLVCRLGGRGRFLLEEAALGCVLYRSLTARWVTMGMEWEATKPKPKWAKVFRSMWIWESPNSTHFFPDIYLLSCCYVNRKYRAIGSRQIGPQKRIIGLWTVGPNVQGPTARSQKTDNWALEPNCMGPNCLGPNLLGSNCPGQNYGIAHQKMSAET